MQYIKSTADTLSIRLTNGKTQRFKKKDYYHEDGFLIIYDPETLHVCFQTHEKYVERISMHWFGKGGENA